MSTFVRCVVDVVDELPLRNVFELDRFEQVDDEGHVDVPEERILFDTLTEDLIYHLNLAISYEHLGLQRNVLCEMQIGCC